MDHSTHRDVSRKYSCLSPLHERRVLDKEILLPNMYTLSCCGVSIIENMDCLLAHKRLRIGSFYETLTLTFVQPLPFRRRRNERQLEIRTGGWGGWVGGSEMTSCPRKSQPWSGLYKGLGGTQSESSSVLVSSCVQRFRWPRMVPSRRVPLDPLVRRTLPVGGRLLAVDVSAGVVPYQSGGDYWPSTAPQVWWAGNKGRQTVRRRRSKMNL